MDKLEINPFENKWQKVEISKNLIDTYHLLEWSRNFSLMTAGYRDQLDPQNAANPDVEFNILTIAILGEAKARVFKRKQEKGEIAHVHIGGETRPHTQDFIGVLARIYAAHGMKVHLRALTRTTPIWYSSFGIFFCEFQSGENLTASHSPYFKGGWKPMDSYGKQLLAEEKEIISEVKYIIDQQVTIHLAPWNSIDKIKYDFDIDEPYVKYQQSLIGKQAIREITKAEKNGFRCAVCPVGGSMKATSEHLFGLLGISTGTDGVIQYFKGEEDSEYHKIGQTQKANFGPDPGKWQIYRNIGAQELLLSNKANVVFIWDPDGDRFNMVTITSDKISKQAAELGLEVENYPDSNKSIVYFNPNQIFFMLIAYRIFSLKANNLLNKYDWFIACSISTTRMIDELVSLENIPVARVRVGFKYMGTFAEWIEKRVNPSEPYIAPDGKKIVLGKTPRVLIMCEESGGATFGSTRYISNKSGTNSIIVLREKDGMQISLLALSLAVFLYNSNQSFAEYYCDLIKKHKIEYKYYQRKDIRLYDESLTGREREIVKSAGIVKRDKTMKFFRDLVDQHKAGKSVGDIGKLINEKLPNEDRINPYPKQVSSVGDGTLLDFDNFWCLIRASGTDAVLRYYFEGKDRAELESFQKSLLNLKI